MSDFIKRKPKRFIKDSIRCIDGEVTIDCDVGYQTVNFGCSSPGGGAVCSGGTHIDVDYGCDSVCANAPSCGDAYEAGTKLLDCTCTDNTSWNNLTFDCSGAYVGTGCQHAGFRE